MTIKEKMLGTLGEVDRAMHDAPDKMIYCQLLDCKVKLLLAIHELSKPIVVPFDTEKGN